MKDKKAKQCTDAFPKELLTKLMLLFIYYLHFLILYLTLVQSSSLCAKVI